MAQVTLTIKLDLPALHKELQEAVDKIKAKLSEVGNVDVDFDLNDLQKDLDKVKSKFKETEESTKSVKGNLREAGLELLKWVGIAQLVRSAFNFLIDSKNVARDAAEIQSKFDTVFRNLKIEANAWAENFSKNVGRAKSDVKQWMAELQDTFVPLGFTRQRAMELSQSLTQLAVDVASFNNASDPEVIRDFTSALVGNHETVRKYGILITENSLKQEAENSGIKKKYDQLTELEKVQLRYNIILKGTADAQGDAIRTADSLANQEKRQAAELKNMQEQLGTKVVPAFLLVTKATMGWISVINELLGVVGTLINKNGVMASQIEELDSVKKKAGKEFEIYRQNLQLELEKKVQNAQATLKLAEAELKYAAIKRDMWGVFGKLFLATTEEERALKNAQIQLETLSAQLEAVKGYGKEIVEETSDTINNVISNTTKVIKDNTVSAFEFFDELDAKHKDTLDKLEKQVFDFKNKIVQIDKEIQDRQIEALDDGQQKELAKLDIWFDREISRASQNEYRKQDLIFSIQAEYLRKRKSIEDKYYQEQQREIDKMVNTYESYFNSIIGMARNSTTRRGQFEQALGIFTLNLLQNYLAKYLSSMLTEKLVHSTTQGAKTADLIANETTRTATVTASITAQTTLATTAMATMSATTIAVMSAITKAASVAATMVSISTFGGAAAIGGAAVASQIAMIQALVAGFKVGGYTGPGDPDDPAGVVHKGEYVFEKDLVDKEPSNYAMLHKMLRAGYSLTDILLGVKKLTSPIVEAPMALAGVNFGSMPVSRSEAESNGVLKEVRSLLQSMDDRLRKIEEKEFQLKGELVAEARLKNKEIAIAVRRGEKEIDRGQS